LLLLFQFCQTRFQFFLRRLRHASSIVRSSGLSVS
jgi:hypothetical protein